MINLDDELVGDYLAECQENLATMETDLFALQQEGTEPQEERIHRVFRALHSVQGGAAFFDLLKVRELASQAEQVVALIRSHRLVSTPDRVRVLLRATDRLRDLIQDPLNSNAKDISEMLGALARLHAQQPVLPSKARVGEGHLRMLLVEDDFASRLLLQTFLSRYGQCHIAVNGKEAVEAVRSALEQGQPYDLICMDIMMPEMDGREAVRKIRALEEADGVLSTYGAKIVMVTAVDDVREVVRCFRELCDAYLMKPIELTQLVDLLKSYQLVQ